MNIHEGWPTEEMLYAAQGVKLTTEHPNIVYLREVIRAALAAAPTLPAQEDEKVYQFRYDDGRTIQDWRELDRATFELIASKPHVERRILYTRPDDKLRMAADEATNILLELAVRCRPGFTLDKIRAAYKNLRAALEQKRFLNNCKED